MITVKKYESTDKDIWDKFLDTSRIKTFLFKRNFMEYHSDRFVDFSVLIYRKGKLEAILPGNFKGDVFYSHQGLTYGGLVTSTKITITDVLLIFDELSVLFKNHGIKEVYYKPSPLIYHKIPMQEDIYALFRSKATKDSCNLSSTIFTDYKIAFTESRKSGIRKARKFEIEVSESDDYTAFWEILNYNLSSNHGVKPVHTLAEIINLKNLFPKNIKLMCSKIEGKMIAGTILFLMDDLIHVQYISANEQGKETGSLDLLFEEIINNIYKTFKIIDFGHSNEDSGNFLNEKLVFQKEGFGGRGVVYEVFHYIL